MKTPLDESMCLQWVRNAVTAACRTKRSQAMIDELVSDVAMRVVVARRAGKFINLRQLVRWVTADRCRAERLWYERHVPIDPVLAEHRCWLKLVPIPTVEPIDGVVMDMKRVLEQLPDDSRRLVFSRARSHRGGKGERLSRLRRSLRESLEAA